MDRSDYVTNENQKILNTGEENKHFNRDSKAQMIQKREQDNRTRLNQSPEVELKPFNRDSFK